MGGEAGQVARQLFMASVKCGLHPVASGKPAGHPGRDSALARRVCLDSYSDCSSGSVGAGTGVLRLVLRK